MALDAEEDAAARRQVLPPGAAIDVIKLIVLIGGGVLPWAAIFGAVRLMMAAFG